MCNLYILRTNTIINIIFQIIKNKVKKSIMSRQENKRINKNNNRKFNKNFAKRNDNKKIELRDYVYYTGSTKQASDYKSTTEFIINYIKGEFNYGNDISESLRNLSYEKTEK